MKIIDAAVEALAMLVAHERAIGRLYATYAHRFPQDYDFWLALSAEEDQHVQWIRRLQAKIEDEPSGLVANRFPTAAINHSIRYINKLIGDAHRPSLTPLNALSTALNIEQTLLENKYFEAFESESAEIKRILTLLSQETSVHFQRIRCAWHQSKGLAH